MMIRPRGGGHGAGAGKTSRVEICNAVADRARVRTAWGPSVRARPATLPVMPPAMLPVTFPETFPVMPGAAASTAAGARTRWTAHRPPRARSPRLAVVAAWE